MLQNLQVVVASLLSHPFSQLLAIPCGLRSACLPLPQVPAVACAPTGLPPLLSSGPRAQRQSCVQGESYFEQPPENKYCSITTDLQNLEFNL